MTWLDCNQRSYIWIFGWTLREDVRLACAQTPELFFDLHVSFQLSAKEQKIIYANLYLNTIIGDSQTSPLPIFLEGVGTSVHRLHNQLLMTKFGKILPLIRSLRPRRITPSSISIILHKILRLIH